MTAQHDVLMQLLATQIEEAVPEPRVLRIGLVAEHRERQVARRPQNFDLSNIDLDETGRHLGVLCTERALAHPAIDTNDEFRAQFLGFGECR